MVPSSISFFGWLDGEKRKLYKEFCQCEEGLAPLTEIQWGFWQPLQMSAAAFAKGLLDLEGELTPIMVKLLHCIWNVVEAHIVGLWVEMLLSGLNLQCWREFKELLLSEEKHYCSTRVASTHVCWIINYFENSMSDKNILEYSLFSFTKLGSLTKIFIENFNISANNVISVEVGLSRYYYGLY
jgi:hypothetical protein